MYRCQEKREGGLGNWQMFVSHFPLNQAAVVMKVNKTQKPIRLCQIQKLVISLQYKMKVPCQCVKRLILEDKHDCLTQGLRHRLLNFHKITQEMKWQTMISRGRKHIHQIDYLRYRRRNKDLRSLNYLLKTTDRWKVRYSQAATNDTF